MRRPGVGLVALVLWLVGAAGVVGALLLAVAVSGVATLFLSWRVVLAERELADQLLEPPAGLPDITPNLQLRTRVRGIGREGLLKHEEIANAALFLASSDSSHTTGELLNVSGGRIMN